MFLRRKKLFWNNLRVSNDDNFYFWVNYPFKYGVKVLNGAMLLLAVERNSSTKNKNSVII